MTKERNVLSHIIKDWAQEHNTSFVIAAPVSGDLGVETTGSFLTWVVKQTDTNIDLLSLVDRLEIYLLNIKKKSYPDGMYCIKCQNWIGFAEPNQPDGSLICYTCKSNPYY